MLDLKPSLARRSIEPKGACREHRLVSHLPYLSVVSDDVMMLRDGDVIGAFAVDGIPAMTMDMGRIEDLAGAGASIVAQATADMGFYVHRISSVTAPTLSAVAEDHAFASSVDRAWQDHLAGAGLRARQSIVTVVARPVRDLGFLSKWLGRSNRSLREGRSRQIARLNETINFTMGALSAARPRRLKVSDGDWLGYIKASIDGQYAPILPGTGFQPVADLVTGSRVDFHGDSFVVHGDFSGDVRFGATFSLKRHPAESEPGIFDGFDLPFDSVLTQSFTPSDPTAALERIQRTARQMSAAEDAAVSLREQLTDAADDLSSGRISFGLHHATVTVFSDSERDLDEASGLVRTAAQKIGAVMVREGIGARAAYFAQHPGNASYRARQSLISSRNYSDFSALHGSPTGLPKAATPWGEAITVFPTMRGEPYRFNFHAGGAPGDRTVGHTLVIGQTGSGKTATTAFLLAEAQRLDPRIIVFDKDRGLEMAVRALGGSYSTVHMGEPTGFNPFAAETDARGQAWLTEWLSALLVMQGPLSADQREALAEATAANQHTAPELRNMSAFRSQFRALDDDGQMLTRLGLWDRDGQYGWLFAGGEERDALLFDDDLSAFDLSEIFEAPEVRTAWLSYVFRRIERTVTDGRPTLIVMDEAWQLLDDAYFEARLKDWMLTMRKRNVAVVLLTQRAAHIAESRAGGSILESVATLLLFPNARNSEAELAPLGLTDAESDFAQSSSSGNRLALIRTPEDSVIVDLDLGALGNRLSVLGGGPGDGRDPAWRDDPNFWRHL